MQEEETLYGKDLTLVATVLFSFNIFGYIQKILLFDKPRGEIFIGNRIDNGEYNTGIQISGSVKLDFEPRLLDGSQFIKTSMYCATFGCDSFEILLASRNYNDASMESLNYMKEIIAYELQQPKWQEFRTQFCLKHIM